MKKQILTIAAILISAATYACSCDVMPPIIEFYASDYVFEGQIIDKQYAKDSLSYTITFDISKHYKNGDDPKTLAFGIIAEGEYTGEWTSCDWSAKKGQNWLVYAERYNGKLTFSGICSNSKLTGYTSIGLREQTMLDHGNAFNIEDYIFAYESGFNYCENITEIEPIFKEGKIKDFKNGKPFVRKGHKTLTTLLMVYIDTKGNLISVTREKQLIRKKDSIFDLITEIGDANSKPITEFERDAIDLVEKIKKWEIKKQDKSGISVPYIRHIGLDMI